ncbi:MAG: AAA family ATPase, partial [Alphaproteobacteria bacterium]
MSFTPSPQQEAAIRAIVDWYHHRSARQQVFRLFGYAGSGKTTTTRSAIDALGLEEQPNQGLSSAVLYAAFTGKAALVMTRKGTPASTIHSLIYRVSEATEEEIERVEKELAQLKAGLFLMSPGELAFARSQIARLELRLAHIHEPRFVLNSQSLVRD